LSNAFVTENGYESGDNADFNRDYAIDATRLFRFLTETQHDQLEKIGVAAELKRIKFLDFLQGEITKRGIIDVLRKGIKYYPVDLIMFYATPTERNANAKALFGKNIFSVTRQLQYSKDAKRRALDFAIFINGLPIITAELKNRWTKQSVEDAVTQYQTDRDPRELIFQFKRCVAHFAIDDREVKFCTKLESKHSWFLPFNKGYKDGAGNPPNQSGTATDYLWKDIFTKKELANIIENYAQVTEEKDTESGKKKYKQIFPRYHQLSLVKSLLADVQEKDIGQK
jgi:type I restriction enzyme R subunit